MFSRSLYEHSNSGAIMVKTSWSDRRHRAELGRSGWGATAVLLVGWLLLAGMALRSDVRKDTVLLPPGVHSVRHATVPWYVRSGQWHADIRSLAAVWRYLTDVEVAQTNGLASPAQDS